MVAHNERPVSPAPTLPQPGTLGHIAAAAVQLAEAIRAFAVAHTTPDITTGQRYLGGQAAAMETLTLRLAKQQAGLDDILPGDGRTPQQRKRDTVLNLLTTYWLPELAQASAEVAAGFSASPEVIKSAVFDDVDMAFDWGVRQVDIAVATVTCSE